MATPLKVTFDASQAEVKGLILRKMLDRGATLEADSDLRLTFWEERRGASAFGAILGAEMAGRGSIRPELHIHFILLPLASGTEVRVLCSFGSTSQRHGQTIEGEAGSCYQKNLAFSEMLESLGAKVPPYQDYR